MSELINKIESACIELSCTNEHLDSIVHRMKKYDPTWFESSCDASIVFSLLGHKEHVDDKLHELKLLIKELENKIG